MTAPTSESPRGSLFSKHLTTPHWSHSQGHLHRNRLKREAAELAASHVVPTTLEQWEKKAAVLRETLRERLHLGGPLPELEVEKHGEIACEGYRICKYSFLGAPGNRIPVNVYIPDGDGPFPAMLNLHGHHLNGKIAERVQERGHILALNGFVTLCVDAAGAGERGEKEREWIYHGASLGAEMFLYGDTLLGQQVRDNMRCVDFLESLPFVDAERIGVNGASGGGNQTMWLGALDERLKVVVPVVSVGSFEAYITEPNCICETLPGFLKQSEEWAILGLIAPRPLLVINALHDVPAFGYEPMSATCRTAQEIYRHYGARHCCDYRILNSGHGYLPEGQEAMLGWVKHWLQGAPRSTPEALPVYRTLPPESLLCFPEGDRPETANYRNFRRGRLRIANTPGTPEALAALVGWQSAPPAQLQPARTVHGTVETTHFISSRHLPIPVNFSQPLHEQTGEIRLIISPAGKQSPFTLEAITANDPQGGTLVVLDLPACGELAWNEIKPQDVAFHDSSRAALWLGYTLAGEWAEVLAALLATLRAKAPAARIIIQTEGETALAAFIAQILQPVEGVEIREQQPLQSLLAEPLNSLAWHVPNLLSWGDLSDLREQAARSCAPA